MTGTSGAARSARVSAQIPDSGESVQTKDGCDGENPTGNQKEMRKACKRAELPNHRHPFSGRSNRWLTRNQPQIPKIDAEECQTREEARYRQNPKDSSAPLSSVRQLPHADGQQAANRSRNYGCRDDVTRDIVWGGKRKKCEDHDYRDNASRGRGSYHEMRYARSCVNSFQPLPEALPCSPERGHSRGTYAGINPIDASEASGFTKIRGAKIDLGGSLLVKVLSNGSMRLIGTCG